MMGIQEEAQSWAVGGAKAAALTSPPPAPTPREQNANILHEDQVQACTSAWP